MSRRDEVEAAIHTFSKWLRDAGTIEAFERRHNDLARTLADEVDAERAVIAGLKADVDHWGRVHGKAPKCAHLNCCAEAYSSAYMVRARDAIIDKLLAMLAVPPDATQEDFHAYCEECWWRGFPKITGSGEDFEALCPECEGSVEEITPSFTRERSLYRLACEIAGRVK